MLFSNDHRENVTAAVIAHDKVTCAPHRMGYTGAERGGGSHVPCPTLWSAQAARPLRLNRRWCWPARGERGRERGGDGSLPPYAGPLAGLWRGERDEAGRGPLKHTPKALFMSMLNFKENAQSQADRRVGLREGRRGHKCSRAISPSYSPPPQRNRMKWLSLSQDHGRIPSRSALPFWILTNTEAAVNCRGPRLSSNVLHQAKQAAASQRFAVLSHRGFVDMYKKW